ncbi:hypothetical protein HBH65_059700 [Parastagonospora nodorum]|nr:hypothetical protein HBH65_059700 [Parastagonospora nodorum]
MRLASTFLTKETRINAAPDGTTHGEPLVKGWAESLLWIVESNMLQGGGVRTEFGGVYRMMGTLVLYRRVRDPEVA